MKTGIKYSGYVRGLTAGKNVQILKKVLRFISPGLRCSALFFACATYVAFFCLCNVPVSGGGTDFPNTRTVAGRIIHKSGAPAPFTDVSLLAEDFVPIDSQTDRCSKTVTTDSCGNY